MKRKTEILFALLLFVSFFLPWVPYMDAVSSVPMNGISYFLVMVFMAGFNISAALTSAVLIYVMYVLFKIFTNRCKARDRLLLFLLVWGVFIFRIVLSSIFSMENNGLSFWTAVVGELHWVCYGIYVSLFAALCLWVTGFIFKNNGKSQYTTFYK